MGNKHLIIVLALLIGMLLISGCEQLATEPDIPTPTAGEPTTAVPTDTATESVSPTSTPEEEGATATPTESATSIPTSTPTSEEATATEEDGEPVEGWTGTIVDLPPGNQFGQYFEREDGERFDIGAVNDGIWQKIREAKQSGARVRIWGTLYHGVPADEARHIEVDRIEILSEPPKEDAESKENGETVEGWTGTIVNLPAGNQFGQYFEREDGERFDIGTASDDIRQQIREAKQSGAQIKIWGTLYRGVPADEARHIEVERIEVLSKPPKEDGEPVEGWTGTIYKLPPGNQFGQHLVRDDGEKFGIGTTDDAVREKMNDAMWTGAQVKVWGTLYHGVPAEEARQIQVERLEVLSEAAPEPRYLSPFARASASSHLPSDRYGQYFAHAAVDESLDTAWAEGVPGPGIGEWIEIAFPGEFELYAVDLANGYQRSDDLFTKNNRIKQATLIFSNGEQMTVDLTDERGRQHVDLIETRGATVETDMIKIVIDDVYPGTAYDDTCLAEIEVYGVTK